MGVCGDDSGGGGGTQWESQPDISSCKCEFFCVYRPYKESISKEMNNDSDLNLHSMTKLSGWLRYWVVDHIVVMVIMTNEGDGNDRDNDGG